MSGDRLAMDKDLIRQAMNYHYAVTTPLMGSMAQAAVYHELGLSYGQSGFEAALNAADSDAVDRIKAKTKDAVSFMLLDMAQTRAAKMATQLATAHRLLRWIIDNPNAHRANVIAVSSEKLAKEITYALIKAGHVSDTAFTAVARLIKSRLDNALK